MLSWTRTLNIDDAHSLLARVEPAMSVAAWSAACGRELAHLSVARRQELVRILRDDLFGVDAQGRVVESLFLRFYRHAPASAQVDLLDLAWALSHPLPVRVADELLAPARATGRLEVPRDALDDLVRRALTTRSEASVRKTGTVVVGALERVGALRVRGAGRNRSLWAASAAPHPLAFGWLLHRATGEGKALSREAALTTSTGPRLLGCTRAQAAAALGWCVARGIVREEHGAVRCDPTQVSPEAVRGGLGIEGRAAMLDDRGRVARGLAHTDPA